MAKRVGVFESRGFTISPKGGVFPKQIILRGKTYKYKNSAYRKSKATQIAKRLKQEGYKVRLYVSGLLSGIGIYVRR